MDRLNDRMGRGREKAIDQMGAGDRFRLRAAVASVLGPHAGESEERPTIIERKPNDVFLAALRIPVRRKFREAVCWDQQCRLLNMGTDMLRREFLGVMSGAAATW